VASLYASLPGETALVRLETAEMIKYACNAFHALKISFANEIGALCGKVNVPAAEVMSTLCKDTRLNTSAAYLKPGFAFGGSCLPKDLRALNYRSLRLDLNLLDQPAGKIGIFGLAFKENTDDLRESPVVLLLEQLLGKGIDLRVFDPHIRIEDIYGSNRAFIMETIPHIGRTMTVSLEELLGWCDRVVLTQKPSEAALRAIQASGLPVLDLVCAMAETPNTVVSSPVA
jgi:GDP-mannose 6-dehydrogenase